MVAHKICDKLPSTFLHLTGTGTYVAWGLSIVYCLESSVQIQLGEGDGDNPGEGAEIGSRDKFGNTGLHYTALDCTRLH